MRIKRSAEKKGKKTNFPAVNTTRKVRNRANDQQRIKISG